MDLFFGKTKIKPERCANCRKTRGQHRSGTLNCPVGTPHRVLGYTSFDKEKVWTPKVTHSGTL